MINADCEYIITEWAKQCTANVFWVHAASAMSEPIRPTVDPGVQSFA